MAADSINCDKKKFKINSISNGIKDVSLHIIIHYSFWLGSWSEFLETVKW